MSRKKIYQSKGLFLLRTRIINIPKSKIKKEGRQIINVSIKKDANQGCNIFGSCLIKGVSNKESPKWLKEKIESIGQKPISAIVDITNYVTFDLGRPLHVYDADKVSGNLTMRLANKNEECLALNEVTASINRLYAWCAAKESSGLASLSVSVSTPISFMDLNSTVIDFKALNEALKVESSVFLIEPNSFSINFSKPPFSSVFPCPLLISKVCILSYSKKLYINILYYNFKSLFPNCLIIFC